MLNREHNTLNLFKELTMSKYKLNQKVYEQFDALGFSECKVGNIHAFNNGKFKFIFTPGYTSISENGIEILNEVSNGIL